jgi:histidine triad (HIT) family protein
MNETCVFCQILAGKAPASVVYHDEQVTAFIDRQPAAPVHLLIVPNQHLSSLNEAGEDQAALLGHLLLVARQMAERHGIQQSGYRIVLNTGPNAGQTVYHLHLHLMGGQRLSRMTR